MRTLYRMLLSSLLALGMVVPATAVAQRSPGRTTTPTRNVSPSKSSTPSKPAATRSTAPGRTPVQTNPAKKPATPKPVATPSRNNTPNNRPAVGGGNSGGNSRPTPQPGTNPTRPGNGGTPQPGTNPSRPGNGGNSHPGTNPGRPTTGPSQPGPSRPNVSAPRPGAYRPSAPRPHNNYSRPNYQPPRPGGGYWIAPPPNAYRPRYYAPVPPPRVYVRPGVPRIGTILGLTFGTFIDASLNMLYNSGYNILGYADNIVYLGNVPQLGYSWPEATVYYSDGLVSDMQFQYWTSSPSMSRYNSVYSNLVRTYGSPANSSSTGGVVTTSWWAGGSTGFITLQYGPGVAGTGSTYYYTTLTYSDYYM